MNYCEKFFRFPIKLYLAKDIEKQRELEESLGFKLEGDPEGDPEYIMGWDCVEVSDIRGFGTIFSRGKSIADVKTDGFDSTIIYLTYGREVGCAWPPDIFRKKLNDFKDKLDRIQREESDQRLIAQTSIIKKELEVAPRPMGWLQRFFKRGK